VSRFGSLRRPGALITVAAAGMLGVGLSAVPAAAHTPTWGVNCSTAWVDLTAYGHDQDKGNTVAITADGGDVLPLTHFGNALDQKDLKLPSHSSPLTVHISIVAADGKQYSLEQDKVSPVCPGKPTPPSKPTQSAKPSSPAVVSPTESAPEASAPAKTSPAAVAAASKPSPSSDNLAETGSSSSTPIIAGAAAVVVVAGAGILWASRRRRAVQH
jgi:LPXTG-motif cell wall-anchored protein